MNSCPFALYPITISSIIPVNLLSYDEKSNWSLYACTFPCSRKEIVSSKYILTVCTLTLSAIIVEIVQIINMIIRHNFYISGLLTIFTIIFIAGLLPPAFMFPFTFKLGAEKGRFAYYIGFILFFALLGWLQSFIKNLPLGLAHFPFRSYYILILFFIGLLLYMISRFIMMNMEDKVISKPDEADFEVTDKWILSKVNTLAKDVTENMDKFELGIAVQKVYDFIWDEFCDWYIELVKYRIYHSDENYKSANAALWTLKTVLGNALKMLHPFMPFVTEEIYSALVPEEKSLMMSDWPQFSEDWCYADAENITDHMKEVIRGVRNARAEMNVPPSRKAKVYVVCEDEKLCEGFEELTTCACPLMSASELAVQADKAGIADDAVSIVVPDASVYVPLEELIDFEQEIERLTKEEEKLTKEINRAKGMLSNEKFVSKAPQAKVDEEKAKLEKYTQMMEQVKERLEALKAGR